MNKVLLLSWHDIDVLQDANIEADIRDVYKKGFIFRILKKNKYLIKYSLGDWKKKFADYNAVILFDTYYNEGIIECFCRLNPKIKIIFYCWNTIETIKMRVSMKNIFNNKKIEIWSYNYEDCKKYSIKYNQQFWNKKLVCSVKKSKFDISFIGSPKNRIEYLQSINRYCEENDLVTYFYITNCKEKFNKNLEGKFMPYKSYILDIASNSRAILDLVTNENIGLTLRPLEALFLGKKLITNYSDIIREPFYNSNNIYILGNEKISICDFLTLPYIQVDKSIIESYDCEEWLKRFEVTL